MKMPFGIHRDKPLSQVPADYLQWCMRQDKVPLYPALRAAIDAELRTRNVEARPGQVQVYHATPGRNRMYVFEHWGLPSGIKALLTRCICPGCGAAIQELQATPTIRGGTEYRVVCGNCRAWAPILLDPRNMDAYVLGGWMQPEAARTRLAETEVWRCSTCGEYVDSQVNDAPPFPTALCQRCQRTRQVHRVRVSREALEQRRPGSPKPSISPPSLPENPLQKPARRIRLPSQDT